MLISYASILVVGLMPMICAGISKGGAKDYDNHDPRAWISQQGGFRARANAAQLNSFEAFPFFAAAVVLGLVLELEPAVLDRYCLAFLAARVLYLFAYIADLATFRTLCWLLGYASCIAIYTQLLIR